MRIGHGYDVHKIDINRKLVLGGVEIKYKFGLLGHSDADVLIHAIMDALLGAACLGDIGNLFPDTNSNYKNISSLKLLEQVCQIIHKKKLKIVNIDSTIIAQEPKLSSYIFCMRENISKICDINLDNINIKATTEEKLGFTGNFEGISAHAVCLLDMF